MYSSHRGAPDRAKSATAYITSLRIVGKNYFGRFYMPVSTPTAKFNSISGCTVCILHLLFFSAVVQLPHGVIVQHVSCGNSHCIAVDNRGQLFSWGDNTHGQLGVERKESSKPV